ncbi:2-keto-4-pentenoate hydratase [Nitrincola tapanii]|uniref:2-keto-4-pentenoate hydratase n=1 Tax=Nitrincola tapanii TaxID=1708751 RepID=A0A5A9VZR5_9GAMM|nr:fumarylacetoacetate hydrolase family protein [Nitrincola tapanii]KAA0873990.1 2-keto-4-pentenoate hydratase [Nitrincola tapanii]
MTDSLYRQLADEILQARAQVRAVEPFSTRYPQLNMADAYAIQSRVNQQRFAQGQRLVGYKIGLTSEAVQQQLGVNEPDFGVLFAGMELRSSQSVPTADLIAPKAEGEIAFVFKKDLTQADLTFSELLSAIDYFQPVIEIVDSVVRDWKITIVDTVADNASSALYMLGEKFFDPRGVDFADLALTIRGPAGEVSGRGAACLGNPLNATWWLARKMAELGTPIQAGQLVLSGAMAPMVNITAGAEIEFDFAGLDRLKLIAD